MYVKVVPHAVTGIAPYETELSADHVIHRVHGDSIHTGRAFLTTAPYLWPEALGFDFEASRLYVYEGDLPDGYDDLAILTADGNTPAMSPTCTYDDGTTGGYCWDLRYVWWEDPSTGLIHVVITGGRIYIMDDSGQTIDKV